MNIKDIIARGREAMVERKIDQMKEAEFHKLLKDKFAVDYPEFMSMELPDDCNVEQPKPYWMREKK